MAPDFIKKFTRNGQRKKHLLLKGEEERGVALVDDQLVAGIVCKKEKMKMVTHQEEEEEVDRTMLSKATLVLT